VLAEIVGYGPIQDLVLDDTVSEIMVNGPRQVWIEREGKLFLTDVAFADADHILRIIQRIVAPLGRRCDESSPMVDARLPDGSRVNAIIPPLSLVGPTLTIRKFRGRRSVQRTYLRMKRSRRRRCSSCARACRDG
jgi:pilus assembly protein CpaF